MSLGDAEAQRTRWLRPKLVQIFEGKVAEVIHSLEVTAAAPQRSQRQRKVLSRTIGSYRRN